MLLCDKCNEGNRLLVHVVTPVWVNRVWPWALHCVGCKNMLRAHNITSTTLREGAKKYGSKKSGAKR